MILMNDFRAEPAEMIRQELSAVERVLRSGWYILGNEVKEFEAEWAARCTTKFAVGVGNGMDAIEIGLRSLGIGPGDEVITTPITAFASVLAILRAGAVPVLADIDPQTALLDPASAERCLTPRTRAVLLVHLYGQVRNMEHWVSLCKQANILLLEDCAQSHLALWNNRTGGTFGAWGAYSFYPTKNLGAIGDGGALVTNTEQIAAQARMLRNYGQSERYHHPALGLNSRLDELQAAILRVRLQLLDAYTQRRKEIANAYFSGIDNSRLQALARPGQADSHVFHLFVVRCRERDRLMAHLQERGVGSLIHYPVPIHHQKPCAGIGRDPQGLRRAEEHAAECLSIPCHPQMSDSDVRAVIEAVNAFK
jgi:dTDP-4-amino-4,6-dideoxygalactose transaminase